MAYSISRRDLEYAHSVASRTASAVGISAKKGEKIASEIVQTVLVGATAGGLGWLSGYMGEVDVMGIPVDIGAAFLFRVAAHSGIVGDFGPNLCAISDGAFAAWATKKGAALGDGTRRKHGGPKHIAGSAYGAISGAERRVLSETELVNMANAVR